MEKNVGKIDAIIRYVLAVIFIVLGYRHHWAFYILTAGLVITATIRQCGPYKLFGINTNR